MYVSLSRIEPFPCLFSKTCFSNPYEIVPTSTFSSNSDKQFICIDQRIFNPDIDRAILTFFISILTNENHPHMQNMVA